MTGTAVARAGTDGRFQGVEALEANHVAAVRWVAGVHAFGRFNDIRPLVDGLDGTAFQSPNWLSCWLEIFGNDPGIECFLLTISDENQKIALALPVLRRRDGGVRVIEMIDLGVSDYCAPLLNRRLAARLPQAPALWDLLLSAMPEADLLRLERQCPFIQDLPNPLFAHPRALPNRLAGWRMPLPDTWDAYQATLSDSMREKLARNGRRFAKAPETGVASLEAVDSALDAFVELERMQEERIQEKGLDYHLNCPRIAAFYRRLIECGLPRGETIMVALHGGGETVAVNFAVRSGAEAMLLRVTNRFGDWARMTPGLLATEFTIRDAQARGVRFFDFGMGTYDYKRRFGAKEKPLMDLVLPLSPRGWPKALLWHTQYRLSRSPLLRRLTGRTVDAPPREKPEG